MNFHYPKSVRLLKRYQYKKVSGRAICYVGHYIILKVISNKINETRIGITVTKAYGSAVARNRFKRVVREAFRLTYPRLPRGIDILVRPTMESKVMSTSDVMSELIKLLG